MKHRIALYLFLLTTLLVGCGDRVSMRQLEQLESRVNDAPDSVLAVLTTTEAPRWGERRALHALLTVQAQDKNGLDVADDSLISVATRYYDRKGLPLRRLQAFYYHGRVYANAGLNHEAMTAYTRAEEFVNKVDAPYPVGLLYAQMGVLYGNDYDYPRALECMETALRYYEIAGKEQLRYIAKRNIGLFYLNMNQFSQADSLFNKVLVWGETHDESYIKYSTLNQLLRLYDATANIEALDSLFIRYPVNTLPKNTATYTIMAHYYALKGDRIASEDALEQAWQMSTTAEDTAKLWNKSYLVGKLLGDEDIALRSHEHLLAHQDSIVRITLQQPLIASQRDHYETRLKVEELRNRQQRYLMRGTAVMILMVVVALGIYIRSCFRRKQEELNEYMELAEDLRHTLSDKEDSIGHINEELNSNIQLVDDLRHTLSDKDASIARISEELQQTRIELEDFRNRIDAHEDSAARMRKQIAALFSNYSRLLNSLDEAYYVDKNTKKVTECIIPQLKKEILDLRKGNKLAALEAILNTHLNNIMARLRTELPHLTEKDYIFLIYLYAGFSGNMIALFMKLKRNNVYQIKYRLCNEIKASDAPSKDFFLENMR
ncbi:MAG: hypothetical protein J6S11_06530 [Bacteroidaceae bacterium]|nr:hypothetical protein [Bacteroidaceae bacterium]